MRDEDIQRLIQINTVSPILLSKYVVRSMMAQREGRIVNIARSWPHGYSGLSVYSAPRPRWWDSPARWRARSGSSASR